MNAEAPLLLAGLDHSGKTALRMALERHPTMALVRRLELWTSLRGRHAQAVRSGRPDALLRTLGAWRFGTYRLDIERLEAVLGARSFRAFVLEIGRQLCNQTGATRWGIQEAMLELNAQSVIEDLPRAAIVQVVRDPRDRLVQMFERRAVGRSGTAGEIAAWIGSTRAGIDAAARHPSNVLVLRYETFVLDPYSALQRVCDFIGEPYDPQMLQAGHEASAPEIGQYRRALPPHQVAFIEKQCTDLMSSLGYDMSQAGGDRARDEVGKLDSLRWRAGQLGWSLRSRQIRRHAFAANR
jgi:hypothetical protein